MYIIIFINKTIEIYEDLTKKFKNMNKKKKDIDLTMIEEEIEENFRDILRYQNWYFTDSLEIQKSRK